MAHSHPEKFTQPQEGLAVDDRRPQDCLTCRVIGTGALGGVGVYALNMSRAHAPGSVFGKRIMAGVGVGEYTSLSPEPNWTAEADYGDASGFLVASYFRWTM